MVSLLSYQKNPNEPKSELDVMQSKRLTKELDVLFNENKRPLFINRVNFLNPNDITSPLILELIPDEDSKLYSDLIEMNVIGIKVAIYFNKDKNTCYPFIPPLLRIIYPQFSSGRVYGGAICTDLLYTGGWSPSNSIITALSSLISLLAKDDKVIGRLNTRIKDEYTWDEFVRNRYSLGFSHGWEKNNKQKLK